MLLQILQLFEERKTISLSDLSLHFNIDKSAMQGMLNELVKKGKISRKHLECETGCTGCGMCSLSDERDTYILNL
ncbi:MAG: FeoC-like transcriptional regulator [Candidatus Cloacimonadales bacterium]|nr:FeoC-like transcriptional regulator [Candidatus Cloacimonadales bacterium]